MRKEKVLTKEKSTDVFETVVFCNILLLLDERFLNSVFFSLRQFSILYYSMKHIFNHVVPTYVLYKLSLFFFYIKKTFVQNYLL